MDLFKKDAVFISEEESKEDVFKEISGKLLTKNYVKESFFEKLVERESNYPTGMDMKVIDEDLPDIAIPHTESAYVNETLIVPVKLNNITEFNNMINPEEVLEVSYLFMILNDQKEEQSNILAMIMDFLNRTKNQELKNFFEYDNVEKIYNFVTEKF